MPNEWRDITGRRIPHRTRAQRIFRNVIGWSTVTVLVVVGLGYGVGGMVMLGYDKNHHVPVECTVVGAEGGRTASGGGRGSVSLYEVVIMTSDCGHLVMADGVSQANVDEIIDDLDQGGRFRLQFGAINKVMRPILDLTGTYPSVYGYEKLD